MSNKTMSIFVIAQKGKECLDSPVFHAGPDLEEEAIAIFTSRDRAAQYIAHANWREHYEVGELQPLQILKWFQTAHADGVNMIAINPDPARAKASPREGVLPLEDPVEAFSQLLRTELIG